jgi:hypothetical protein
MSAVSLRIPESIHRRIREMANLEGVSINQLITSALVEKLSSLRAEEYLAKRAARGSRAKFDAVLAKVRDAAPMKGDESVEGDNQRVERTAASGMPLRTPRPSTSRAKANVPAKAAGQAARRTRR